MKIQRKSIAEVYNECCKRILSNGDIIITEDNEITYEHSGVVQLVITDPCGPNQVSKGCPQGPLVIEQYCEQLMHTVAPTGTNADFDYLYANRLFDYPELDCDCIIAGNGIGNGFNQIQWIINTLDKNPTSRRAVAMTRVPLVDCESKHPPCLTSVQCFIRDDAVNMICYMRSWDMLSAANCNMVAFAGLLDFIADSLNVSVGSLTMIGASTHIYFKRDDEECKKFKSYFGY